MLQNNWLCKSVTSVWQYCIMANYSWILMEGLYLHNLIFLALFSDTSSITLYVVLGWGKQQLEQRWTLSCYLGTGFQIDRLLKLHFIRGCEV
jgi:hypothetical protein